jgi:pimeloyl-ACP methyl ester carboxylesterase
LGKSIGFGSFSSVTFPNPNATAFNRPLVGMDVDSAGQIYIVAAFDAEAAGLPDPDNGPFASGVYRIGVVTEALMVAARCPEKVKALIIEDSPLTLENYKRIVDSSRDMFCLWLELKESAQSEEELSLALADKYKNYPGITSAWILFFAGCLWQLDPTFFNTLLYDFDGFTKGYDYKPLLAKINCSVLFIRGEAKLGAVMTDDEVSWLEKNCSNVSCVEINGVGHLLHLQDQGQTPVLTEMMTFLERMPKW